MSIPETAIQTSESSSSSIEELTMANVGTIISISQENKKESLKYATTFRSNLIVLLNFAKTIINEINSHPDIASGRVTGTELNYGLLGMAITATESSDPEHITKGFIIRSVQHWEKIANRDLNFLINNADVLFKGAPEAEIRKFSEAFEIRDTKGNRVVTESNINNLWTILNAL